MPEPLTVAVLVKQIPAFEEMQLGPDGRLLRAGLELEMNPYCRRAVSKAVELVQERGGRVTIVTLGPPSAEDTLREAIAWASERDVDAHGVLVTDPAFAGSDTLATARALAAALERLGPFDLVLTGRNSVDADTGQVGPELAELLDLPFMTGVRHLHLDDDGLASIRCEHDDGWLQTEVRLPAVLSTAERLCEPCKVDPPGRAAVAADRIRSLSALQLGPGPWGQEGSPTWVGPVRVHEVHRLRRMDAGAPLDEQVRSAVQTLLERGALDEAEAPLDATVVPARSHGDDIVLATVVVVVEPNREHLTRELLGEAAALADRLQGTATAFVTELPSDPELDALGTWGADAVVALDSATIEEDIAAALADWCATNGPWGVLVPSTAWGREVASRAAARLGAGLTGDAVDLDLEDGRLVAWKPAFGGQLVAAIRTSSPVQMATVRAGTLPTRTPRTAPAPSLAEVRFRPRHRITLRVRARDDDLDVLAEAAAVIGVGTGVQPEEYDQLEGLRVALGAALGATRQVTDKGWLPRARQIGITGRSIAPRLYVALGLSGKFNHMVGVRAAGTVLAINSTPDALVFDVADIGVVGDWREALPLLEREIAAARQVTG